MRPWSTCLTAFCRSTSPPGWACRFMTPGRAARRSISAMAANSASGNGLLGADLGRPSRSGRRLQWRLDLIYLPGPDAGEMPGNIVTFLSGQDYASGLFVNDALGKFPGALPMRHGEPHRRMARTPTPAICVNFRSFSGNCGDPLQCTVEVADTLARHRPGQSWQLQPGRDPEFHGRLGPRLQGGLSCPIRPRSPMPPSPPPSPMLAGPGPARQGHAQGPGDRRSPCMARR